MMLKISNGSNKYKNVMLTYLKKIHWRVTVYILCGYMHRNIYYHSVWFERIEYSAQHSPTQNKSIYSTGTWSENSSTMYHFCATVARALYQNSTKRSKLQWEECLRISTIQPVSLITH